MTASNVVHQRFHVSISLVDNAFSVVQSHRGPGPNESGSKATIVFPADMPPAAFKEAIEYLLSQPYSIDWWANACRRWENPVSSSPWVC